MGELERLQETEGPHVHYIRNPISGAQRRNAAIPLQVSLIEKSWHSADYDPDAHAINIELGVEDLRFVIL